MGWVYLPSLKGFRLWNWTSENADGRVCYSIWTGTKLEFADISFKLWGKNTTANKIVSFKYCFALGSENGNCSFFGEKKWKLFVFQAWAHCLFGPPFSSVFSLSFLFIYYFLLDSLFLFSFFLSYYKYFYLNLTNLQIVFY